MALPKVDQPVHVVNLPGTNQEIRIRSFTVKEEKIILTATQDEEQPYDNLIKSTVDVVKNCIVEPEDLDVEQLPILDIEYIFLLLRMKSKGERIPISMTCKNILEDGSECNTENEFVVDLNNTYINRPKGHSKTVDITDSIGITLQYPTLNMLENINPSEGQEQGFQDQLDFIIKSIQNIYDSDTVYDAKNENRKELEGFLESLTDDQLELISTTFFEKMPQIRYDLDFKCTNCGYEEQVPMEGLSSFF